MTKRIAAIIFIFLCASAAWLLLGVTIFGRTERSGSQMDRQVESNWGSAQEQAAPVASFERTVVKQSEETKNGVTTTRDLTETQQVPVPLIQSRVGVGLDLSHRQKGLLWYATYRVGFTGNYVFRNTSDRDSLTIRFAFPAARAMYDDVTATVNDQPVAITNLTDGVTVNVKAAPGSLVRFGIRYRSQGLSSWRYTFGTNVSQVSDFAMRVHTNFADIDFPENTLSPTAKQDTGKGWDLEWRYANMISGYPIGITMPEHVQPGPLAGKISLFAPVSLFFFFFLMFMITTLRGIELHPMNYLFLAAGFFAFHLLLAYLVDHISIHLAFLIASATSLALVVSYLRLVVDMRFAIREAALAQFLFLILFSYAFFFEGFTGLAITIGSVLTLFVIMQITGRVRWAEKFAAAESAKVPTATR